MRNIFAIAALCALAACSTAQTASVTASVPATAPAAIVSDMQTAASAIATGKLVCQLGPTFLAAVDPSGAAVIAKGASSSYVKAACASVNAVAVAPPANGVAGTISVTVPAAS